jgi:hypothetical protein
MQLGLNGEADKMDAQNIITNEFGDRAALKTPTKTRTAD